MLTLQAHLQLVHPLETTLRRFHPLVKGLKFLKVLIVNHLFKFVHSAENDFHPR